MIHLLTEELKKFFPESIPKDQIFDKLPIDEYSYPPYVCIIAKNATITEVWDNYEIFQGGKIQEKFSVSQPFELEFNFHEAAPLCDSITDFLATIPRYVVIQNQAVDLHPQQVSYSFSKGGMDIYKAELNLTASYSIYSKEKEVPVIKSIDHNVFPHKEKS